MREKSAVKKNISTGVASSAPWRLTQVTAKPDYILEVQFNDGASGVVDMKQLIMSDGAGVFASLRDTRVFDQVYLDYGAATWPGEIDLAPDAMYSEIKKHGKWIVG